MKARFCMWPHERMGAWTCMGACACGSVRISDWIVSVTRFCVVDSRRREPQLPWASKSCEFGLKNTKRGLAKKASRQSPFFFLRPKTTYPVLCLKKKNGPVKNGSNILMKTIVEYMKGLHC